MIIGNPFNLMDYIREFTEYNIPAELGLYHLFYDDELVYVGKSVNIQNRLKRHLKDATKEFNNVLWFLASGLSDDRNNIEHISQWEKRLIQELNPPYNVVYNR
jgi:excinuclease UvrABC nuclease subunit